MFWELYSKALVVELVDGHVLDIFTSCRSDRLGERARAGAAPAGERRGRAEARS